jgi:hypothetical protein
MSQNAGVSTQVRIASTACDGLSRVAGICIGLSSVADINVGRRTHDIIPYQEHQPFKYGWCMNVIIVLRDSVNRGDMI